MSPFLIAQEKSTVHVLHADVARHGFIDTYVVLGARLVSVESCGIWNWAAGMEASRNTGLREKDKVGFFIETMLHHPRRSSWLTERSLDLLSL